MKYIGAAVLGVLTLVLGPLAQAAQTWTEGTNYAVISPAQKTHVAKGKIEVMEVFSYGCPACNNFQPAITDLEHSLPPNAQMVFLPASFIPSEDWVMLQRAYFTAQTLGIAARTHQQMFDAIWQTGELQTIDPVTHSLRKPLPSIEDAANFYQHQTGIKPEVFLATAKSDAVTLKMRDADAQITAMQVPGTPCIVVNGKYRVIMDSLQTQDDLNSVVRYLLAKDAQH